MYLAVGEPAGDIKHETWGGEGAANSVSCILSPAGVSTYLSSGSAQAERVKCDVSTVQGKTNSVRRVPGHKNDSLAIQASHQGINISPTTNLDAQVEKRASRKILSFPFFFPLHEQRKITTFMFL